MIHYWIGIDSTRCCARVSKGRFAGVRGLAPGFNRPEMSQYADIVSFPDRPKPR